MSKFTSRIVICVLPVLLAAGVVGWAYNQYRQGKGGFKLGVDLVGGTILIYEVDQSKLPKDAAGQPILPDIQLLAERLKKRIDAADLRNITVRSSSAKDRIEIILPTGGKHQIEAEQRVWDLLVSEVEKAWPVQRYLAKTGQTVRLLAEINAQYPDTPVAEVKKFIAANYQPGGDPDENRKKWEALLEAAAKQYEPKHYVVGRGQFNDLVLRVLDQHPNAPAAEVKDLINPEEKKKQITSLTTEAVQETKEKVSQTGSLEFMIVANDHNDKEAMNDAERELRKAGPKPGGTEAEDPELKKTLDAAARAGNPPPPPGKGKKYKTDQGDFSYRFVEIGNSYRQDLGLSNPRDKDNKPIDLSDADIDRLINGESLGPDKPVDPEWVRAAAARKSGGGVFRSGRSGGLIYSREVKKINLADKDRDKRWEYFLLMREPEEGKQVTGDYLDAAWPEGNEVHFRFKPFGGDLFYEFTKSNIEQPMAIVLDGAVQSVANIQSAIRDQGRITGKFTAAQVNRIVNNLKSGSLPATLKRDPVSENTMGPTLGADTIEKGTLSVLLAFGAVLLFMIIYYRFAGLVACVALLANLLLTVAFMVLVQATFTLPGLAGLVLMLGMAVDANVLIYERLREERDRGASLALAIRNGYDRAFPTIIDTHLSSIFTAIVLYVVGNDQLKGFGISLTVGLIISLFTSLYVTRTIFDIWLAKGWLTKLSMLRFFSRPNIDFMRIRYYWFTATIVLTVLGAALFIYRLDKGGLNIDFTGGTAYGGQLAERIEIGELRKLLGEDAQAARLKVADVKALGTDGTSFLVTYEGDTEPRQVKLVNAATEDEVRRRAGSLPDSSVEQIFVSSPQYTQGDASVFFTMRTSEKEVDIVQAAINRLLGGQLKRIYMTSDLLAAAAAGPDKTPAVRAFGFTWDAADLERLRGDEMVNSVALAFGSDEQVSKPDFASRAQVSRLLARAFEDHGLKSAAQQMVLEGLGREEDGRFQWMELKLTEPVSRAKLKEVLADAQRAFVARPQPERLENFDSQLATETQTRALYAILASWAAILLYLWFRFGNWTFGAAAVLCLVHDLFFTLGIIALCHWLHDTPVGALLALRDFKIDLPTVAALLTLVGYSVNDTIVVFDRIREVRGKNPELTPQMINDSVNQTLSRTLLASLTTWLVVFVLYVWGGEGVHLFAFVMVVGVIVGTYSSIYIASPLLLIFGEGRQPAGARERRPEPAGTPG